MKSGRILLAASILAVCGTWARAAGSGPVSTAGLPEDARWRFEEIIIDDDPPQPARVTDLEVVDVDGDGKLDIWLSGRGIGSDERKLPWYENTGDPHRWRRFTPFAGPCIGSAWGDIDGDGDPDLISGRDRGQRPLVWMENPAQPDGNPRLGPWRVHEIHLDPADPDEIHTSYVDAAGHMTEHLDMNGDGRLDIVIAAFKQTLWYVPGPDDPREGPWVLHKVAEATEGHGGACVADIDGDGDLDIAWGRDWYENQGDPTQCPWPAHTIDPTWSNETQVAIADMDGDGRLDVVLTGEESAHGVAWYRNPGGDSTGAWHKHQIVSGWEGLHSLQVADLDGDGDRDVLTAEMHTRGKHRVAIFENLDAASNVWTPHILSTAGSHKAKVADVDADGDPDVIGKNFDGDKRPRLWLNPGR